MRNLELLVIGATALFYVRHRVRRHRWLTPHRRPLSRPQTGVSRNRPGVTGPRRYSEAELDTAFDEGVRTGAARERAAQARFDAEPVT